MTSRSDGLYRAWILLT